MAFHQAKHRCTNPNAPAWKNYGGRGIQFRFESFEKFFEEIGERPTSAHSLDRKDNDGHYEPGNVRWATKCEQNQNQRKRQKATNEHLLTIGDRTLNIRQWATETGTSENAIYKRLNRGWSAIRAVGL